MTDPKPLDRVDVKSADGSGRSAHPDGEVLGVLSHGFGANEVAVVCDRLELKCSESAPVTGPRGAQAHPGRNWTGTEGGLSSAPDTVARKIFYLDQSCVNLMTRYNFQTRQGAMQLDYWVPLINSMKIYFQYWNGYGESLIDYNVSFVKYGGGMALTY